MSDAMPTLERHAIVWVALLATVLASAAYSAGESRGKLAITELRCPTIAVEHSADAGDVARCVP